MDRKRKASSELPNERKQPPPVASSVPNTSAIISERKHLSRDLTDEERAEWIVEMDPEQYEEYLWMYAYSVSVESGYLPSSPGLSALNSAQAKLPRYMFDCQDDYNGYMPLPDGHEPAKPGEHFAWNRGVGFCIGRFSRFSGEAYMDLIVVNPAFRGKGHGRRMYRDFFRKCKRQKRNTVVALMKRTDLDSQAFHKALGFKEGKLEDGSGYDEETLVAMRKRLTELTEDGILQTEDQYDR